jgi:hypothetical protein
LLEGHLLVLLEYPDWQRAHSMLVGGSDRYKGTQFNG